jgi:hypothetical protein
MTNKSPSPTTNATPEDKLRTLLQDQALRNAQRKRDAGTFLSHTHSDEGGRFAKPQQIVGSAPVPEYPAGPNWSPQAVGVEPPLGFDINETPVVGEYHEIEKSIERERAAAQGDQLPRPVGRGVGAAGSVAASSQHVEPPLTPIPLNKTRRP